MPTAGGIKAGKAFVEIGAIDKTGRILNQVSKKLDAWAGKVTGLGKSALAAVFTAAVPSGFALRTFQQFDDSMLKLEARSIGTAQQMEALREQAAKLGRTTAFTAQDVGELQTQLAMKGFTRGEILEQTPHVLALARATGELKDSMEDISTAAKLTGVVMRTFDIAATDTQTVVDALTVGVKRSGLTLEAMSESMKYIGPLAKQAGLSLQETVTTIGMLGRVGIEGSMAGTAVRRLLLNFSDASKQKDFNEQLKALTGQTVSFVDEAGNLRKLPDILNRIGEATKGMGSAQKFDTFSKIFGDIALPSGTALTGGANPFADMMAAQAAAAGEAQRTMDTMERGIGGAWRRFTGAIEGVAMAIGQALAPKLIQISAYFENAFDNLAEFVGKHQDLILAIAAGTAALAAAGVSLVALGASLKVASIAAGITATAFKLVSAAAALALSPIGLFTGAIAGGIAILTTFSQTARSAVVGALGAIADTASSMANTVSTAFSGAFKALMSGQFELAARAAWAGMKAAWLEGSAFLQNTWSAMVTQVLNLWDIGAAGLQKGVLSLWYGIRTIWTTGIGFLIESWYSLWATIERAFVDFAASFEEKYYDFVESLPFAGEQTSRRAALAEWQNAPTTSEAQAAKAQADTAKQLSSIAEQKKAALQLLDREGEIQKRNSALNATMQERLQGVNAAKQELRDILEQINALNAEQQEQLDALPAAGVIPAAAAAQIEDMQGAAAMPSQGYAFGAINGAEKGTVEALKHFYENQNRQSKDPLAEKQIGILEKIEANTAKAGGLQLEVVG